VKQLSRIGSRTAARRKKWGLVRWQDRHWPVSFSRINKCLPVANGTPASCSH